MRCCCVNSTCAFCCGSAVDLLCTFIFLTDLLTNILTTVAPHDNIVDVLAACCTIDVASAVAMSDFHTDATLRCLFKRLSVIKTKFI